MRYPSSLIIIWTVFCAPCGPTAEQPRAWLIWKIYIQSIPKGHPTGSQSRRCNGELQRASRGVGSGDRNRAPWKGRYGSYVGCRAAQRRPGGSRPGITYYGEAGAGRQSWRAARGGKSLPYRQSTPAQWRCQLRLLFTSWRRRSFAPVWRFRAGRWHGGTQWRSPRQQTGHAHRCPTHYWSSLPFAATGRA